MDRTAATSIGSKPDGDSPAGEQRRRARWGRVVLLPLAVIAALLLPWLLMPVNSDSLYPFIRAAHPIDAGSDVGGRWFYYMPASGAMTPSQLAAVARADLVPRGFKEDTTKRPWFRFVNGGHEVIVCNHDQIATAPTSLLGWRVFHAPSLPAVRRQNWPVVWVREPGPNAAAILRFKAQKFVLGW
jgi:hypothetical protein